MSVEATPSNLSPDGNMPHSSLWLHWLALCGLCGSVALMALTVHFWARSAPVGNGCAGTLPSTCSAGQPRLLWSLEKQGKTLFEFDRAGDADPVFAPADGVLRISIPAGYAGKWMAIKALSVVDDPAMGHHFTMCAQCSTSGDGPNVQLGVYDGCDKGSPAVAAPQGVSLHYEWTEANVRDISQFKINIFPHVAGRCDVVIKNWDIHAY